MEQEFIGNLNWTSDDKVIIKIEDYTKKVIYKAKVRASDKKGLALILTTLEKYGINIKDVVDLIEQRKNYRKDINQEDWFGYPLGDKKL